MTKEKLSDFRSSVNEGALRELAIILDKNEKMPRDPDMVYLVGQTKENQEPVLTRASEFSGVPIGLVGDDGTMASGFPGFSAWKHELEAKGVPASSIVGIPGAFSVDPADGMLKGNTRTEAQALVRYAKEHGFKKILIVAKRWHLTRAFMTVVTVLLEEYPELRVYAKSGDDTGVSWFQQTVHSQGTEKGRQIDIIKSERKRISKYHMIGHLVSPEKVLEYLEWRDRASEADKVL